MSDSSIFDAPDIVLEYTTFPHLTGAEWDALNRLAEISRETFVVSLMRSTTPDEQRLAIHDFTAPELAESNRRGLNPSRSSRNDSVKMETSAFSGEGKNGLSLSRWFRKSISPSPRGFSRRPRRRSTSYFPFSLGKTRNGLSLNSSWTSTRSSPWIPSRMTYNWPLSHDKKRRWCS